LTIELASFKIAGMYCISCKPIIENQLKGEKAVKDIRIDYMTESVIFEFDPTLISIEDIKNRLAKSGYRFVRVAN
jgi:copper chaperone CopZ